MRNANAKADLVPEAAPCCGQGPKSFTQFKGHEDRLQCRVLHCHWITEHDHHTVTSVAFERAAVFDDLLANGRVILAEQRYYVLRVCAFGETCEAAQVTEERDYFPTMAFQLLLCPRSENQISHLRWQEAPQPAHALDFAYLVGDALFEFLIEPGKFLGLHRYFVGFSRISSYRTPFRASASRISARSRAGVTGRLSMRTPSGRSASSIAQATAGGATMRPPSPAPFTPYSV